MKTQITCQGYHHERSVTPSDGGLLRKFNASFPPHQASCPRRTSSPPSKNKLPGLEHQASVAKPNIIRVIQMLNPFRVQLSIVGLSLELDPFGG